MDASPTQTTPLRVNTPEGAVRDEQQARPSVEQIYRQHLPRLVGLAEWIVGSPMVAEEIVHDVFVRVVEHPPSLRDPSHLQAYIRTAVVNRCRRKIRRFQLERKHAKVSVSEVTEPTRPDEELRQAVRALPMRQRQAVVLRFYEDLTVDDIATTLGISPGSVKTHLHRAMRTLEGALDSAPHIGDTTATNTSRKGASR